MPSFRARARARARLVNAKAPPPNAPSRAFRHAPAAYGSNPPGGRMGRQSPACRQDRPTARQGRGTGAQARSGGYPHTRKAPNGALRRFMVVGIRPRRPGMANSGPESPKPARRAPAGPGQASARHAPPAAPAWSSTVQPPARPARRMKGRQSWTRPPRTGENRSGKPAAGRDRTKLRPSPRSKPALSGPMPSSGPFQQPPWRRRHHLAGAPRPAAAALARSATKIRPIAHLDQLGKRRFGAERARSGPPRTAPRRPAVHPAHEFQRGTVEIKGGPSNRNRRRAGPIL